MGNRLEDFVATVALRMITIIARRADERSVEAKARHVSNTSKITINVGLEAEIATRERRRNSGPASFDVNISTRAITKRTKSKLLKTSRASNIERPKNVSTRHETLDLQIVASAIRDPNGLRHSIRKIDRGNATKSRSIFGTNTSTIRIELRRDHTRTVRVRSSRERSAPTFITSPNNSTFSLTLRSRRRNRRLVSIDTLVLSGLVTRVTVITEDGVSNAVCSVVSQRRRARRRASKTKKTLARSLFLVLGRPRDKNPSTRKKDRSRSIQRWSMHNSGGI